MTVKYCLPSYKARIHAYIESFNGLIVFHNFSSNRPQQRVTSKQLVFCNIEIIFSMTFWYNK